MAYSEEKACEQTIRKLQLEKYNDRTITTIPGLKKELKSVREKGYGIDYAEELEGVHCISAPIFNQNGSVLAAIWTTAPSSRLPLSGFEDMAKQVKDCAHSISASFGYNLLNNRSK